MTNTTSKAVKKATGRSSLWLNLALDVETRQDNFSGLGTSIKTYMVDHNIVTTIKPISVEREQTPSAMHLTLPRHNKELQSGREMLSSDQS